MQDTMIDEADCVELGLACADVCQALDRVTNGGRVDELNQRFIEAAEQLTT